MVLTNTLLTDERDAVKTDIVAKFLYGAVGTDNTTPTAADTTLGAEVLRSDIDASDTSGTGRVISTLQINPSEANGNTLNETGWFLQNAGGDMYTRNTFISINKTSDVTLVLDTSITIEVLDAGDEL